MSEPVTQAQRQERYWRRNLALTAVLLMVWFAVSFVCTYFARDLSFRFFGWPFSYWLGAQGALVVFVVIVAVYARLMNAADARFVAESSEALALDAAPAQISAACGALPAGAGSATAAKT